MNRLLDETEKNIAEIRDRLKEFEDTNKIIGDLSQKRSDSYDEMSKTKKKLDELNKKEQMIKDVEIERFNLYKDIIITFREWKQFVGRIIAKFEVGKDTILDQLSFGVSINLTDKEYLTNINELINNKSISEETVHGSLDESILHRLYRMANRDENPDFDDLSKHMDRLSKEFFEKKRKNVTYSVFHDIFYKNIIEMRINIKLDGIPLESLSMGQRAIVLLKIILAYDDKPLIIDQPEEDLDNRYIYEQLVTAFKEAKTKRQIIIVTHNANLAVNTDSEQVIVAKYNSGSISYEVGSLENLNTKNDIKQILEGGEDAFKKREEKYGYIF